MEGRLKYLSQQFQNAVSDFLSSLEIDLTALDSRTCDAVMNGHILKFEFCKELFKEAHKQIVTYGPVFRSFLEKINS